MQKIIDTHCHLSDLKYEESMEKYLSSLNDKNILAVINIGCSKKDFTKVINQSYNNKNVYYALGIHPESFFEYNFFVKRKIFKLSKNENFVAVGEIGLDYYYSKNNKDKQKKVLIKQIRLADKCHLPFIIHCRDAFNDLICILKEQKKYINNSFVVHCFSSSIEIAKEIINLGGYVSFNGVVTFKNASKALDVLKSIDKTRVLAETDSPYLSPEPNRGKLNYPHNTLLVMQKISELWDLDLDDTISILNSNAKKLFKKILVD